MTLLRPISSSLSPRELEILRLLAQGLLLKEVEVRLGISESTVKGHLVSARWKLNAENNIHVVALLDDYRPGWRPMLAFPDGIPAG